MSWRWWLFIFILSHVALAKSVEVILNPYDNIDYDRINVYTFDDCNCQKDSFTYPNF